MPKLRDHRKARFRAALAIAGLTQAAWAEREGVTAGHLSAVLSGVRDSQSLWARIETFTAKHLPATAA